MGTGEAYVADLRKDQPTRVELCEIQDEMDDGGSSNRMRFVFLISLLLLPGLIEADPP